MNRDQKIRFIVFPRKQVKLSLLQDNVTLHQELSNCSTTIIRISKKTLQDAWIQDKHTKFNSLTLNEQVSRVSWETDQGFTSSSIMVLHGTDLAGGILYEVTVTGTLFSL